jgi:ribosomal protein S12 methylthiotransferase accessory factor
LDLEMSTGAGSVDGPADELFVGGTKRAIPPEATFERIQRYLAQHGITRLADITGLDCLGVPVFAAVRPRGRVLQGSQGKGARAIDAKVSALMESLELSYAENPLHPFVQASMRELERADRGPVAPTTLPTYRADRWSPARRVAWIEAEDLVTGRLCMLPGSSVYYIEPSLFAITTNGLASGNNVLEATLHALYEIYERDAASHLVDGEEITFDLCDVIELETIQTPLVVTHIDRFRKAGVELRLFRIGIESPIHTFVAVLLDDGALAHSSQVNLGVGSHLSPTVAASRAITEAAQSRLTYIHAAREELSRASYTGGHGSLFDYFESYEADTAWSELSDASKPTMAADFETVMEQLRDEGVTQILRHTLTLPADDIAVVKVIIPGTRDDFAY